MYVKSRPDRITFRLTLMAVLLTLITVYTAGCSTASGFGGLMQGVGKDIEDAAEGTRQRMYERRAND